MVFITIGLAGVIPALPFFFLREPLRQLETTANVDPAAAGIRHTLGYIAENWCSYATFMSLMLLMITIAYASFWNPAMFERTFGWPPEKYALINGLVTLPVGIAVYWLSGTFSDRWTAAGHIDAPLNIMIIGAFILTPLYAAAPLMPNGWTAFVVLNIGGVGMMMLSAVSVTALLGITPATIRGQIVAIYYMVMSLFGQFVGPTAVGFLSQHVFGEDHLNQAMATLPVIMGLIPLTLVPVTRKLYRQHHRRVVAGSEARVNRNAA